MALWEVIKDGGTLNVQGIVANVLPTGKSRNDFSGWQSASVTEHFQRLSDYWWHEELANVSITVRWEFNGQYIADFHVTVNGHVQVSNKIDIAVQTLGGNINQDNIAELPYEIAITNHNLTGGIERATIRAMVSGNGSGMSLS